ncbi:MAG: hypothetical protein ABI465_17620 [Ktedonobacteraceae bacterium]
MSTEPANSIIIPAKISIQHNKHEVTPDEKTNPRLQRRWNWQDILYLLLLVGLVVVMAYRFTPNFSGEVAGEWWDPLLNMWTLSWDTTTLLHAPTHLWQAQLLYPNNLSLSYSENLLGEAIIYAPFFLLSHNPVFAYNMTFYISFLLCGTNMYIMARHYTGKPLAAFVAALIYAFAPYRLAQLDHIHIIAGEWMPLAFLYLDLALEQGRWRNWILFALFYFLQLLSSIYYGIFLSYALLAFVLIRYTIPFIGQLRSRKGTYVKYLVRRAIQPVIVFAIMFIFLGILMAPYLVSLQGGFSRSLGQSTGYAAFVRDFIFAVPFNWLYGTSYYNGIVLPYDSEHYLFLGLTTMALAACGIILAWRKRATVLRAYSWTALIVLLFAFGPFLQYSTPSGGPFVASASSFLGRIALPPNPPNIPMPWVLAYFVLPGFSGLRVPARLIGVLLIMLALLAAFSVAWLQNKASDYAEKRIHTEQTAVPARHFTRLSPLRTVALRSLLVLIPLAILVEAVPAYTPVTQVPTGNAIPAVYQWLSTHGNQEPIVELPMAYLNEVFSFKQEAWYDYYAIYHTHPIADGWSGYRPPLTNDMAALLLNFPSASSLTFLKQYHIRYVVLHLQYYNPAIATTILAQAESNAGLRRIAVFGSDSVWQVI